MSDQSCIIIAIAGASASGKSLIASTIHEELCNELGCEEIGIVTEDSYYKDQTHLSFEERIKTNYDHPNSMDRDLLIQHLCDLKKGKVVDIPVYSYVEHTRTQEVTRFEPKKVIILEGILLLTDERIRQEVNMSVLLIHLWIFALFAVYNVIWKNVVAHYSLSLININPRFVQCSYNLLSHQNNMLI